LTADTGANCSDESYWLIDDRKYPNIILRKQNFDKKVFGDIAHIFNIIYGQYRAFDIFRKYIVVWDLMVSKNRKDITKHYTLNDVPLQLQMEAFGIFR
jgi:hypothetical protein